MKYSVIMGMI